MNFSRVPPYRPISFRQVSKYPERSSLTSSASRDSDREVNPTRSANRIETSLRSATGASGCPRPDRAAAAAAGPESEVPHSPQKPSSGPMGLPHDGHACASGDPHFEQNFFEE